MASNLSFDLLRARLEIIKALANRWPAGTQGGKGGQFAPKGSTGGASGTLQAPQLGIGPKGYAPAFGSWGGNSLVPKTPPKGAKPHPQMGEDGKPVTIDYPSRASSPQTWTDKNKTATFTPGSATPEKLNGVKISSWKAPTDKAGWAKVDGTNPDLDALPFQPHPTKKTGAGVMVVEPDGRVWLTRPTNSFGGYVHTFPKGTAEDGLSLQQNAIKEAYEETGLKVKIVGVLGDYERDTSKARFFVARRVGGTPKDMGWESQAMRLAPMKEALQLLNKPHDKDILNALSYELSTLRKAAPTPAKGGAWQKQERWPEGTPVGGQWKAMGADGLTLPPKLGSAANPAYDKKAATLHAAAQAGDIAKVQAYVSANAEKLNKFDQVKASGITPNSQTKWAAGSVQYGNQLIKDYESKGKAVATADKLAGPAKLSAWKQTGAKPGGSNPGAIYTDENGVRWLVKGSNAGGATKQSHNEVLASKLMAAAGIGVPDMKLVDLEGKHGGGIGVASKMMDSLQSLGLSTPGHLSAAQADFAVHAWLANYDAIGMSYDNTKIGVDGKAVNIDPGGALEYRAQGKLKTDFTNSVLELKSMRDAQKNPQAAAVYGSMTSSQIAESAKKVAAISDDSITKMVMTYGGGTDAEKKALAQKLINRKQDLAQRVLDMQTGEKLKAAPAPTVAPTAPASVAPAATPKAASPVAAQAQITQKVTQTVFHNTSDGHNKFWAVSVSGNTLVTHYGKIGTAGSTTTKQFGSTGEASDAAAKLMAQKTKGGYSYQTKQDAPDQIALLHGAIGAPVSQKPAAVTQSAPSVASATASVSGGRGGDMPSPPTFVGIHQKKYSKFSQEISSMSLDALTATKQIAGGNIVFTTPSGTITLKNPPSSSDGHKFYSYFNSLVAAKVNEIPASTAQASVQATSAPKKQLADLPAFVESVPGAKAKFEFLADKATNSWASGNLTMLEGMFHAASNENTHNSGLLTAHIGGLMDDLKAKQTATLVDKMGDDSLKAVNVPQPGKNVAAGPAMPDFDKQKLPTSNTNAASHNKKIDQIKASAQSGDVKALLGMSFATNTYGVKQAKIVNDTLASLGIAEKVTAGQKANTHPALFGGMKPADAADLLVSQGKAIPKPPQAPGTTAVKIDAAKLPSKPEFITSKVEVKKENEHHAEVLLQFARNGDLANLKSYDKFSQLSQKLTEFKQDLVQELEVQLFPPRPKSGMSKNVPPITIGKTPYKSLAAHAEHFKPVPVTDAYNVSAHHKAASFVMLGKTDAGTVKQAFAGAGTWTGKVPQSIKDQHNKHIETLDQKTKDNVRKYTTNWAFGANDQMRNKGEINSTIQAVSEAIHKASLELPEGSQYARSISISGGALKQIQALQPGDVIQSPQFESIKQKGGYGEGKNVEMRLVAAAGAKAIWVDDKLSAHKGEMELVMAENARYAINRVYESSGKTIIEAVILPTVKGTLKGKP